MFHATQTTYYVVTHFLELTYFKGTDFRYVQATHKQPLKSSMIAVFKFYKKPLAEAVAWRCAVKKVFLKFRQVHRKTPVPESFFNKVAGLRPTTLLKKRPRHKCFPLTFAKLLRRTFFNRTRLVAASALD